MPEIASSYESRRTSLAAVSLNARVILLMLSLRKNPFRSVAAPEA
jgi:hypothetical protein